MKKAYGFTIIELLISIVVIAILATITIVAYNGISQRANEASLQSDLSNANKQIALYRASKGVLPTANNCSSPGATEICLNGSPSTIFNYAPDNDSAPTTYRLSATNGSISFISSNGSTPQSSYGSEFVSLTNLAQNGDFNEGATGWMNYCQGTSQCLFNEGVSTLIANPDGRAWVKQELTVPHTNNDKIFYSARVRKDSGSDFTTIASRNNGGYDTTLMTAAQFNSSTAGQFVRHSGLRTFLEIHERPSTAFSIGSTTNGKTFQATIDDVVIINLTASFGAGNEPTAATMHNILTQFNNGYFSDTVDATY